MRVTFVLTALALAHIAVAEPNPAETKIRSLIGKLTLDELGRKETRDLDPGQYDTWLKSQKVVFDAAHELIQMGAASFPYVLEHLNDKERSVQYRSVVDGPPPTVGETCKMIISNQLYSLPDDYSGSLYRTGADGKLHERPVYMKELFSEGISKWLADRKGRTFSELQLEALSWVLAAEEQIGTYEKADEKEILSPLRDRREQLAKQVEAERKK
jgi:hypothetical protein